jgi:hypothetical protein
VNQVSPRTGRDKSLRLFDRQRQLLRLLDELGGRLGNLDFQRLLFLYCQGGTCACKRASAAEHAMDLGLVGSLGQTARNPRPTNARI